MQFLKKYHKNISVVILIIAAVSTLFYHLRHPSPGFLRKISLEMIAPLEWAVAMPGKVVSDLWNHYVFLVGVEESNRKLVARNSYLLAELIKYREGYQEGLRLQRLLNLRDTTPFPTVSARVVGRNPSSLFQLIIIDRGEKDGLRPGLPVLAVPGVAGRVLETSWNASRVLLITDESSNMDAIIQESRVQGILQGASSMECRLKYVPKTSVVNVGDVLVSSGIGGIFPKGLPLGVVSSVNRTDSDLFLKIKIAPFVNTAGMEEVLVIMPEKGIGR